MIGNQETCSLHRQLTIPKASQGFLHPTGRQGNGERRISACILKALPRSGSAPCQSGSMGERYHVATLEREQKIESLAEQFPPATTLYHARTQTFGELSSISTKEHLCNVHKGEAWTLALMGTIVERYKHRHASNTLEWSPRQHEINVRNVCQKRFPSVVLVEPSVVTQKKCMHVLHQTSNEINVADYIVIFSQ